VATDRRPGRPGTPSSRDLTVAALGVPRTVSALAGPGLTGSLPLTALDASLEMSIGERPATHAEV
jgi:hypothetical protein